MEEENQKFKNKKIFFSNTISNFYKLNFINFITLIIGKVDFISLIFITKKEELVNLIFIIKKIGLINLKCIIEKASFIDLICLLEKRIIYIIITIIF